MSFLRICIIVLSFTMLLGACGQKKNTKLMSEKEETMISAKADCMQQAQSMYNETIDTFDASSNSYYTTCMQTKYGYTPEQIRAMDN